MPRNALKMSFFVYMRVALYDIRVRTRVALYDTRVCTRVAIHTRLSVLATHVYFSCMRLLYLATRVCIFKMSKNTPFEFRVVWVVMQLTPSIVTTLSSPLTLP